MRRLIALVTAASFAAVTPVFAQSAAPAPAGQPSQTATGDQSSSSGIQPIVQDQSLLLDGQDAYDQQNPNSPFGNIPTGVLIGLGVAGAAGIIIAVASSNHNNNSVSP